MEQREAEPPEVMPEPEAIQEAREIIREITKLIDSGELEQLSCYVGYRDGDYRTFTNANNGRHEDSGRILELALRRLGFVQGHELPE